MPDTPPPSPKAWIPLLGLSLVSLFLAAGLNSWAQLSLTLIGFAGIFALGAAATAAWPRLKRDRFDLGELRAIHEREELRSLWEAEPTGDYETVTCLHCGNVYSTRYPTCPKCGQR